MFLGKDKAYLRGALACPPLLGGHFALYLTGKAYRDKRSNLYSPFVSYKKHFCKLNPLIQN